MEQYIYNGQVVNITNSCITTAVKVIVRGEQDLLNSVRCDCLNGWFDYLGTGKAGYIKDGILIFPKTNQAAIELCRQIIDCYQHRVKIEAVNLSIN